MYKQTIQALPHLFSWQDMQPVLDSVYESGIHHAAARTQQAFDRVETIDPELARSMRSCLDGLSPVAAARFMTAPETAHQAAALPKEKSPARNISFLCSALMAERALTAGKPNTARPCWTALGDYYFSGGQSRPAVEVQQLQWKDDLNFSAPLLGNAVPLDFSSPHARATTPCRSPFQPYDPEQVRSVCSAMQDSFNRIGSVKPAGQIIARFARVIVLRKDVPAGHSSSSTRSYPGRLLLRNPEAGDVAALASSMIHESIHHFLYTVEFAGEFVESSAGTRVTSPWSGRELALHSYLHACFVWYGLARFWHKQISMDVFPSALVRPQLTKALSGFRTENPAERLMPQANFFVQEVLDVAGLLREELRKAGALDWNEREVA